MSKKWLNATFLSFLIRCLRLWRGQHLMQGKPCYASAFCGFAAHPPGGPLLPLRGNSPCVAKSEESHKGLRPLINPWVFRQSLFRGAAYGAYRAKKCDNVAKCGTNEIFYAKILIMMKFDQRYEKYKAPFGAVEAGSLVRFFMKPTGTTVK